MALDKTQYDFCILQMLPGSFDKNNQACSTSMLLWRRVQQRLWFYAIAKVFVVFPVERLHVLLYCLRFHNESRKYVYFFNRLAVFICYMKNTKDGSKWVNHL
jgi:hypothetical protein